ncbi:MAG: protein TolR [Pseudomonadota bacterium]
MLSEINVVPYIDVMLVLLVIFMVTAPLLVQRVDVDLPVKKADPLGESDQPPIVISIQPDGSYNLYNGAGPEPLDARNAALRAVALQRIDPSRSVLIQGDKAVPYGRVVELMSGLEGHGVTQVGLVTLAPGRGG